MAARFKTPSPTYSGATAKEGGRLKAIFTGILSVVLGSTFLGAVLLVWAANLATCFGFSHRDRTGRAAASSGHAELAPRRPDTSNVYDVMIVRPLVQDWLALGHSIDSINVWVFDDDQINAASLGDGSFVLFRGLHRLERPALDAIYAHEISHDQLRHGRKGGELKDVTDWLGGVLGTFAGDGGATTETLQEWSGKLVRPTYTRKQELEADRNGVLILKRLGYDSAGTVMCRMLAALRSEVGESGGGFFSDHPALSERVRTIHHADSSGTQSKTQECG
jgi:Zn-dependent protease with chaperone function